MIKASGHGKDPTGEPVLQVGRRPFVPGLDPSGDTEREHVVTHLSKAACNRVGGEEEPRMLVKPREKTEGKGSAGKDHETEQKRRV